MNRLIISAVLAAATIAPFCAISADQQSNAPTSQSASSLAVSAIHNLRQQSMQTDEISNRLATIKSRAQLKDYLSKNFRRGTIFDTLSPPARARFLASLTFNRNGLTGFEYADLENELTATQVYKIMNLFGMQHTTSMMSGLKVKSKNDVLVMTTYSASPMACPVGGSAHIGDGSAGGGCDYKGYKCVSRATCQVAMGSICTSNC